MERLCSFVCLGRFTMKGHRHNLLIGKITVKIGITRYGYPYNCLYLRRILFFFSTIRKTKAEIKSERCVRVYAVDILQKCMGNVLNSIHSLL